MSRNRKLSRRDFVRGAATLAVGGAVWYTTSPGSAQRVVWQIDPTKCTQCGRCMTHCVLEPSAVKCVHAFEICGYCDLCGGYLQPGAEKRDTGAESQLCPVAALRRRYVEHPYYEYTIDEEKCVGCGKCVKGCGMFGNGSLYLQVQHDLCVNCNECAIAKACPSEAFKRVPASEPYITKERPAVIEIVEDPSTT